MSKTKEYYMIRKKLNRKWLDNLIWGILSLIAGILSIVLAMMEKHSIGGALFGMVFILALLVTGITSLLKLKSTNKYKESIKKIKLREIKGKMKWYQKK